MDEYVCVLCMHVSESQCVCVWGGWVLSIGVYMIIICHYSISHESIDFWLTE